MATDKRRVTVYLSGEAARTLEGVNASALTNDVLLWAARLDLTEQRVRALEDLAKRLSDLDHPYEAAGSLAEHALADAAMAHQYLAACGWVGGEVLAVMQAMMGTMWMYGMPLGGQLATEMLEGQRLGTVDLAQWGVSAERWLELSRLVYSDSEAARALLDVARVFWRAGGSALEKTLYRGVRAAAAT